MESLYKETVLDHYHHPRNRGSLADADVSAHVVNPLCGDEVALEIKIENNQIQQIAFVGRGCILSQAAASILTEYACNKSLAELEAVSKDVILPLVGISVGPTRLRCVLLALEALQKALSKYRVK